MKAIILAGGRGIRLQPYTDELPKSLISIDGMPILHIILLQLRESGFYDIIISVHYKAQLIEEYFGNGDWLGLKIEYSHEHKPLGTAGPLSLIGAFDQPALVMNTDLLTAVDFRDIYISHQHSGARATIVLCQHTLNVDFGIVEIDDRQRVVGYVEKPSFNFLVSGGIYVLEPTVLKYLSVGAYTDMPALLQAVLGNGHLVNSYLFMGDWLDIGTPEHLRCARESFRLHRARYLKRRYAVLDQPDQARKIDITTT